MTHHPRIPKPGAPKKGFFGFIAGLFPERPEILEPPTSTDTVPLTRNQPNSPTTSTTEKTQSAQPSSNDSLPQTDEQSAPNSEGETTPPSLATPRNIKTPSSDKDEGVPTTLSD